MVIYSQGNFLTNQRDRYRNGGVLVEAQFEKDSTSVSLKDFNYMPFWVFKGTLNNKYQYYAIPVQLYLKDSLTFSIPDTDRIKINQFYNDTKMLLNNVPENNFFNLQ